MRGFILAKNYFLCKCAQMKRILSKAKIPHSPFKAVDFFCGAGGMTYGLSQAGINVLAGIDNAESCAQTYEKNNPSAIFLKYDISELQGETLAELIKIQPNDPNLIFVGCSPCQYWSRICTSKSKSIQTAFLLKEFQRFVEHFLPGFIILENVQGILTNKESYLPKFLNALKQSGYVFTYGILDASKYGVPQHRRRFVLIASRVLKQVSLPLPINKVVHVSDVIGEKNGFPSVQAGNRDDTSFQHIVAGLREINILRLKKTPKNGGTRHHWKDDEALQINAYKGKDDFFNDVYGRMKWDSPAPTMTTKFYSLSNGRFGHPEDNRAISIREGAALQTFPKDYYFWGSSIASLARQIGNAVPPLLSQKIGEHIIKMVQEHGKL